MTTKNKNTAVIAFAVLLLICVCFAASACTEKADPGHNEDEISAAREKIAMDAKMMKDDPELIGSVRELWDAVIIDKRFSDAKLCDFGYKKRSMYSSQRATELGEQNINRFIADVGICRGEEISADPVGVYGDLTSETMSSCRKIYLNVRSEKYGTVEMEFTVSEQGDVRVSLFVDENADAPFYYGTYGNDINYKKIGAFYLTKKIDKDSFNGLMKYFPKASQKITF